MRRTLREIQALSDEHRATILCAGDIFDKWNSPAELINFALEHFPEVLAIPGNHDLPMHSPDLVERSAYWTLVKAGRIRNLVGTRSVNADSAPSFFVTAVPFNGKVPRTKYKVGLNVCLIHQYLWVDGKGYTSASNDSHLNAWAKKFRGYDVVVVGDNHMGFVRKLKTGTTVLNCGTVLRRKSNEAHYQPQVGLIHASGEVTTHKLDTSRDVITELDPNDPRERSAEIQDFIEELDRMREVCLDFRETLSHALKSRKVSPEVRALVLEALE